VTAMRRRAIASTMSVLYASRGASVMSVRPAVKDRRRVSGSAGCEENRLPRRVEPSTPLHLDGADGRTAVAWSSGLALPGVTVPDQISDDSGDIHQPDRESARATRVAGEADPGSATPFRYPVQPRSSGARSDRPFSQGKRFPSRAPTRALRARDGAIGVVFRREPVNDHPQ
jgi:hypothetical protein